jgi:hypothetical protein
MTFISNSGATLAFTAGSTAVVVSGTNPILEGVIVGDLAVHPSGALPIAAFSASGLTLVLPAPSTATVPFNVMFGPARSLVAQATLLTRDVYAQIAAWADRGLAIPVIAQQNTPPTTPADGDRYLIGTSPTGAWATPVSRANLIATWSAAVSSWLYTTPAACWTVGIIGSLTRLHYSGSAWGQAAIAAGSVALSMLESVSTATLIGRLAAGSGAPVALTAAQARSVLGGIRERLAANRTYFVRTDGSDSNDGLTNSSAGAFLTVRRAIDVVYGTLDLGGFNVTIQVGNGTYTGQVNVTSPQVGSGVIEILGDTTTPSNVVFNPASGNAIGVTGFGSRLRARGIRLTSSGGAYLAQTNFGGFLELGNIEFGTSASQLIYCDGNSVLRFIANYAFTASAPSAFLIQGGAVVVSLFRTITLTGAPAFSVFANVSSTGVLLIYGCTFTGAATGARYYAISNAVIDTGGGGASYLPGNSAGAELTGGRYV